MRDRPLLFLRATLSTPAISVAHSYWQATDVTSRCYLFFYLIWNSYSKYTYDKGKINTNITFICYFTAHRANHQDWAREACLPMHSSICLELITFIHHQHRLSGDLQISVENSLSVYLLTVAHTSDLITFRQRLWSYDLMALYKSVYYYYNYY